MSTMPRDRAEMRICGCPEQYAGRFCPACHGTGQIPPSSHEPLDLCGLACEISPDARRGRSDAMVDRVRYGRFPGLRLAKRWVKVATTSASDRAYAVAYIREAQKAKL